MNQADENLGGLPSSLLQQLEAVKLPIETSVTLPPSVYSSETVFEQEKHRLFFDSWVGIGRADRWKSAGDYSAIDIMGVPIVVLRDRHDQLQAFANSCRHRGAKLIEGEGNCPVIRCPFHRWTYALDGRLLVAPKMEQTPGFEKTQFGLVPVQIDIEQGFAFVCFNPEAASLGEWLGDFSELHVPWALSSMSSTRRREFEVACNWKIFLEVFNEYYHLPFVHPETLDDIYDIPENLDKVNGNYVSQFGSTQGTGALLNHDQSHSLPSITTLSSELSNGTRYTWMFPNMTFAAGKESIWVYEVYPISPTRTWVGMTVCFPVNTVTLDCFEDAVQHYYYRMDKALDEDIPALENQQAGIGSPLAKQGRFSFLEPSVATFACWYSSKMRQKETADLP